MRRFALTVLLAWASLLATPAPARISHTGAKCCTLRSADAGFLARRYEYSVSLAAFRFAALAGSLRRGLRCSSSQWNHHSSSSRLALGANPGAIIRDRCEKCGPAFDPHHAAWTRLLERHVQWNAAGTTTTVDYDGLLGEHDALRAYLAELSALPRAQFDGWSQPQRRAFLINAYNAWTVELILREWPGVESIKDLGSLFSSPWKQRFFTLFGEQQHLDGIEHGLIRGAADYDDPRIHFAVNCASIGCPALRPEAYRGADLEAQLDDQTRRFLRDRTRNRFDAAEGTLYLSSIFDWYGKDFGRGLRGSDSVAEFVAGYPAELGIDADTAAKLAAGEFDIEFLDYDWTLNRGAR